MKSSILILLFLQIFFFSSSKSAPDPNSLYKSFLQCLPTRSPEPNQNFAAIVYGAAANSSAYTKVLQEYVKNSRLNTPKIPKPAVVITPARESHVQAAVLCAKQLNVQIKTRSGGHDYEGVSYTSSEPAFVVLDMFNLRTITINMADQSAVVGAGAQLGELYYRIWEKSKVHGFPAGVCPTVGVGGHLSGGGYGTMIRKYGLAVDHIIDAKIVDVKGRILDRKAMGEDLFWAIRGGGGGSFGVILSYTVKLVPVPAVNTVFRLIKFEADKAVDLVEKWQTVIPSFDPDLFVRLLLQPTPVNGKKTTRVTFIAHFLGDSNRLLKLMNEKFPELGLKKQDCLEVSWIQSVLFWANFNYTSTPVNILLNRHSDKVNFGKRKSDYVQTPIGKPGLQSIFNKLAELGKIGLVFNSYGGRMAEVPADATPFPHRAGNLFKIQYSVNWNDPGEQLEKDYLGQSRVMYDFMTPFVSKNPREAFLNYRDLDIGVMPAGKSNFNDGQVYGRKYFKGNFDRLVKVKTAVDPENFFRNEQSIPVLAGKKSTGESRKMMMKLM